MVQPSILINNRQKDHVCILPYIEILYNKETCHRQLKKYVELCVCPASFTISRVSESADFIAVVRVHQPSSRPTDFIACFDTGYSFLSI